MAGTGACDSCGLEDQELEPVRRVYLDTDTRGRVSGTHTQDEVEHWCLPCRTLYPNQPAED